METVSDPWLRRFHPSPGARHRLVCFPHAGGAASTYHPLSQALRSELEVLSVQYPGRQDRRSEPLVPDIESLADQAYRVLRPWAVEPLALFGHSMGAVVAFEVARRLEAQGPTAPVHLFVSGRRAPSRSISEKAHLLDDASLVAEIQALGGTEADVFADEELLRMVLPVIRNDYRAIETYECAPGTALRRTPVTAFVSDSDPRATVAEVEAWSAHTAAPFDMHVFEGGGHFYLASFRDELASRITERLHVHL